MEKVMAKQSAADPQNERELFFQLNGKLEQLIVSLDHLTETFREWKTKEFADVENEVDELLKWKNEVGGAWKMFGIILAVLTLVSLALTIINAAK